MTEPPVDPPTTFACHYVIERWDPASLCGVLREGTIGIGFRPTRYAGYPLLSEFVLCATCDSIYQAQLVSGP